MTNIFYIMTLKELFEVIRQDKKKESQTVMNFDWGKQFAAVK